MYLAGKLSKFEVTDWIAKQPRHQRWWDMFVEDISLEILEGKCCYYCYVSKGVECLCCRLFNRHLPSSTGPVLAAAQHETRVAPARGIERYDRSTAAQDAGTSGDAGQRSRVVSSRVGSVRPATRRHAAQGGSVGGGELRELRHGHAGRRAASAADRTSAAAARRPSAGAGGPRLRAVRRRVHPDAAGRRGASHPAGAAASLPASASESSFSSYAALCLPAVPVCRPGVPSAAGGHPATAPAPTILVLQYMLAINDHSRLEVTFYSGALSTLAAFVSSYSLLM